MGNKILLIIWVSIWPFVSLLFDHFLIKELESFGFFNSIDGKRGIYGLVIVIQLMIGITLSPYISAGNKTKQEKNQVETLKEVEEK